MLLEPELPPEDEGPTPPDPPELEPASQLPESCAARGDFFLKSYGEFEFCFTSDSATEEMAFEDTDGVDEDEEEETIAARENDDEDEDPPAGDDVDVEEHPSPIFELDAADDEEGGGAVHVLVQFGIKLFKLFILLLLLVVLLLVLLLDELEEAGFVDDPEPGAAARTGPLFC